MFIVAKLIEIKSMLYGKLMDGHKDKVSYKIIKKSEKKNEYDIQPKIT